MRKVYGWSKTSKTPSRYEHLSGKDARVAKLRQAGIFVEEDKEPIRLCPRCKKPNPAEASMCHACGSVLTLRVAVELQRERDKLKNDVEELKLMVGQLISSKMKLGETREQVEVQVTSQKRLLDELKKHDLVQD